MPPLPWIMMSLLTCFQIKARIGSKWLIPLLVGSWLRYVHCTPWSINRESTLSKVKKSKDWLFIYRNCKLGRNRWVSLILFRFARPQCLAAIHLSSPEVGNGLSWPKPQCTCNAMVTSQAQRNTNEEVLLSNSACSMLMSDDLRLPKGGIELRPSGFRGLDSTARPLPLLNYDDLTFPPFAHIL